ncbi:MAG TPA: DUF5615 family PIN-like protein [Polyangiaceae bacterium]
MTFLLDASLSIAVVRALRDLGLKASHASELGLATEEDVLIRARAEKECVVVTRDDLEPVLWRQGEKTPSILRMLAPKLDDAALAKAIRETAMVNDDLLSSGAIVTSRIGRP